MERPQPDSSSHPTSDRVVLSVPQPPSIPRLDTLIPSPVQAVLQSSPSQTPTTAIPNDQTPPILQPTPNGLRTPTPSNQTPSIAPLSSNHASIIRWQSGPSHGVRIITIITGSPKDDRIEEFRIHERILRENAPALTAHETIDSCIKLPTTCPEAFRIYHNYIYSRRLFLGELASDDVIALKQKYTLLMKTYILGTKLGDIDFQDAIMDAITSIAIEHKAFPTSHIKTIYENTKAGDPLRRFLVDVNVFQSLASWVDDRNKGFHTMESLFDIVQALQKWKNKPVGPEMAPYNDESKVCHYHAHDAAERECYRTKYGR